MRRPFQNRQRKGQTIIFLIMVLVILFFVVVWNFDLHKILHVKSVTQNAGDSAALMAARWQGISINLIGDLNILHALAISAGDRDTGDTITNVQARLCYTGPAIALMACQQAAKNNGIYLNTDFTSELVRDAGNLSYPPEYAAMLGVIAANGVAARPRYFNGPLPDHILYREDFYAAIAARNWCWFFNNEPTLLQDYRNFFPCWWPELPPIPPKKPIFDLGLVSTTTRLSNFMSFQDMLDLANARGMDTAMATNPVAEPATWYCYDAGRWTTWDVMSGAAEWPMPLTGVLKEPFDYTGADAVVYIQARIEQLTPGQDGTSLFRDIKASAAAKPFGVIGEDTRPNEYGLVLPAFRETHLIPMDASSGMSGSFRPPWEWESHVYFHLMDGYMVHGPLPSSCWYCQQLLTWENTTFRQSGIDWLELYSERCIAHGGGGGGRGGPGGRTMQGH